MVVSCRPNLQSHKAAQGVGSIGVGVGQGHYFRFYIKQVLDTTLVKLESTWPSNAFV